MIDDDDFDFTAKADTDYEPIPGDFFNDSDEKQTAGPESDAATDCLFPFDAFHGPAANLAREIAENRDVPPELPFISALAHSSASLGKGLVVRNDHLGQTTNANLFIVVSAGTSSGKGQSMDPFAVPFQALQLEAIERHREETAHARIEKRGIDKLKGNVTPEQERRLIDIERKLELREPCFIHTSPTIEGLKAAMETWGGCGFISSSEAGSFISVAAGRYSEGKNIFSDLCGLFSGTPVGDVRKGHGQSVCIPNPLLSVCLAAQPELFAKLRSVEAAHVGILNRALWCIPSPPPITHPDVKRKAISLRTLEDYAASIRRGIKLYGDPSMSTRPAIAAFDREAGRRIAFINFEAKTEIHKGNESAEETGRRAEVIARVSLGLHFMEHGSDSTHISVPLKTVTNAERLVAWAAHPFSGISSEDRALEDVKHIEAIRLAGGAVKPMTLTEIRRAIGLHRSPDGKQKTVEFLDRAMTSGRVILEGEKFRLAPKKP